MAAVKSTGLTVKGVRSEFYQRFEAIEAAGSFQTLATRVPSTAKSETYTWLGTAPRMREFITERQARGVNPFTQTVENKKYETTMEVDGDEISDDQTGQIRLRVQELAQWAGQHKDSEIGRLLNEALAATSLAYDGVPFYSDSHSIGSSGTIDNSLTASATAILTPTSSECKTALRAAVAQMKAFKDDKGEPWAVSASGLTVVCPPNQEFAWREALNATIISNTSNTDQGMAQLAVNQYLTDLSRWHLLKTDGVMRPFLFQDREPMEFTSLEKDSEEYFRTEKMLFGARARYRFAYGQFIFAVTTDFT